MSKRRKTGVGPSSDRRHEGKGSEREAAVSNQEMAKRLGSTRSASEVDLDTVRRAAFPLVERAILALQTLPPDGSKVNRFVEVVARSHLPEERKQELVDRLLNDQASGEAIEWAMTRHFGDTSEDLRSQLVELLDGVWSDLQHGSGGDGDWVLEDGRAVQLDGQAMHGPVGARAEQLVDALSTHLAAPRVREQVPEVGAAVRGFCRDVYLAVRLAREEDEDEEMDAWPAVEEG